MVTISFFSRTLVRLKGMAAARDSFTSISPQPGSARMCAITAAIPSSLPAMVPLIPSFASNSVPRTALLSQAASKGARSADGSSNRAN